MKTKNGNIKSNKIISKKSKFSSSNGKIHIEDLCSDKIDLECKNGKTIASIAGEEIDYAMDIKTHNGKSIIAGKVNRGNYIYKDKEKTKEIIASTQNGSIVLNFLYKRSGNGNNNRG